MVNKNRKNKSTNTADAIITRCLILLLASTLFLIFGPTRSMLDQHHDAMVLPQLPGPASSYAEVTELEHEDAFRATIQQCLPPNPKCKQFILPNNNNNKRRVAVIAPPGDLVAKERLQAIAQSHDNLELIFRTHVPPYGYGKTHGLTQVIRFIPQPLLLQVTDALQSLLQHGETHAIITLSDLKAGLRQILRFHCRLSHLAAHTALLSVAEKEDEEEISSVLQSFLFPDEKPPEPNNNNNNNTYIGNDDDPDALYQVHAADGTQTLTHVQSLSRVNVLNVLDQVLLDELQHTRNLTIWPCPSFWSAGDAPDPTKISPLVQRLAQALSPDCEDPYAKCWVERDKCEAVGDARCVKNKK
ncbi:hypothetical protein FisN_7Lh250 [Fistulifera solaris]|uniref:Uncharacterized protein n=1 Tax=Fistulifera solaris TaxID=1519565 RepID=A0A1Z5JRY5_FISSO|nr:hypothetical protein FisN_7Lh250 [Fistulifera solaris]|eukprot:GAX16528.1 hypothetical protein FisN_7Lh250 [Fistulifera solaris]